MNEVTVRFGVFYADLRTGELRKQGVPIRLQEKPFQLLLALLEHPGDVVTRDELQRRLWGDQTFVDFDRSLNIAVAKLRSALGDSAESPRFIETLPRRGYRFIAPIEVGTIAHGSHDSDQTVTKQGDPRPRETATIAAHAGSEQAVTIRGSVRGAVRHRPILIGALTIAALAIAAFAAIDRTNDRAAGGPRRFASLAVLPLENLSGDPEQEYLADGITEALITELGKIESLRVISRTSILRYKGTRKSLPEIGRELGADAIVEGSVVRSGNRIRITAQLIDTGSDAHVWARAFERDIPDVLALYGEVAAAIGSEIHVEIDPTASAGARVRTVDPEAWALYMKGRYVWARGGAANLKQSREYFLQAIGRQPDFAIAYAGLADAYLFLATNGVMAPTEVVPKAKAAASKALELDQSLAEAYTSLGGIACTFEADWSGAERAYRRALEINPSYAIARHWWGLTLAALGRHAEAATQMRRALEIDPVSLRAGAAAASALYLARRYPEAREQYKSTLELDPSYEPALIGMGNVSMATGRMEQAIAELEHAASVSHRTPSSLGRLGHAYGMFGQKHKALKILAELRDLSTASYVSPLHYAVVYLGLRDDNHVFQLLQQAAEQQLSSLWFLRSSAEYDVLRADPRFAALLRRVNLN